jgi:hypothetical protein
MSMGNPTDLGINRYLETTSRTTFSALLNRGIDAINTYLRDIMKAGDTGWIQITTFVNSWTATDPVYYRRLNGVVYWRGTLSGGTSAAMFTIPAGFRPVSAGAFLCANGTSTTVFSRVGLGTTTLNGSSGTTPVLNGVSYPAS